MRTPGRQPSTQSVASKASLASTAANVVAGPAEDRDERVADHLERVAVVRGHGVADDQLVPLQCRAVALHAERSQHRDRPDHVGDEERHGAGREARRLDRLRERGHRAQRRERVVEPVGDDLVDPLGPVESLEHVLAEITQLEAGDLVLVDETGGRPREEDLTAVAERTDPRRPVDAHAEVAVAGQLGLRGMDPPSGRERLTRRARARQRGRTVPRRLPPRSPWPARRRRRSPRPACPPRARCVSRSQCGSAHGGAGGRRRSPCRGA